MNLILPIFAQLLMIVWFAYAFYKKTEKMSKLVIIITYIGIAPYLAIICFKLTNEPMLMKVLTIGSLLAIWIHVIIEVSRWARKKITVPFPQLRNIFSIGYFHVYSIFSIYIIIRSMQESYTTAKIEKENQLKYDKEELERENK